MCDDLKFCRDEVLRAVTALVNICGINGVSPEMVSAGLLLAEYQAPRPLIGRSLLTWTILIKVELWAGKIVDNNTRDDGSSVSGVTKEDFIQRALQLDIVTVCLRSPTRDLAFSH